MNDKIKYYELWNIPWGYPTTGKAHIYFIEASNGLLKIGSAKDVMFRFETLSRENACDLKLIHSFHTECREAWESLLHYMFKNHRKHGEWFDLTEQEKMFMRTLEDDDFRIFAIRYQNDR